MVRVPHSKPAKQAAPSNGLRGAKVSKQRNRHKVVFEDVEQKKEKSLYFRSDPPKGYTFIPAGNPQLTEALKEFAKKGNHEIFAVTTTPHASRHELSREVHRIGWHFPTEVVSRVCNYYGIRLTGSGKLVEDKDDDKLFMKVYQRGQLVLDEKVRDQVTINTEAKQIIKDLFPNMPDNDLFKIIKTAFQVGDGKVGTADEIPLVRRAQLSVVAHIRHTYTSYDKLLRQVAYSEARHAVEAETLKKLIEWRGDDEDKEAVEDTLREVVVISDEEDSDDEIEDGQILNNEDVHVQLVSSVFRHDHPLGQRPYSPVEQYSTGGRSAGYRYVPQVVHRLPVKSQADLVATQQRSRHAVWDRYRQEYQATIAPQPSRVVQRILVEDPTDHAVNFSPSTMASPYRSGYQSITDQPVSAVSQSSTPTYVRGADGRLYEKIIVPSEDSAVRLPHTDGRSPPSARVQPFATRHVSPGPYPQQASRAPYHGRTISHDENDGTVVQSIENSVSTYQSPNPRRQNFEDAYTFGQTRHSGGHQVYSSSNRPIEPVESFEYGSKRRRVEVTPPSPFLQRNGRSAYETERGETQRHHSHRDQQEFVQRVHDMDNLTIDSSTRSARPETVYEPAMGNTGSQIASDMPSLHPTHRDVYTMPTKLSRVRSEQVRQAHYLVDDQSSRRPFAPLRSENDRKRINGINEDNHQEPRQVSTFQYATARADAPNAIRYIPAQDQRGSHQHIYYENPQPRNIRPVEYTPVTMARQVSAQDRGYHVVTQTPVTYHQQPLMESQTIRYGRNEIPFSTTYVQQ